MTNVFILCSVGKLKQPTSSQSNIRKIEWVKLKVFTVERIYPDFLFTENLIKALLADPVESKCFANSECLILFGNKLSFCLSIFACTVIEDRKSAEAKKMSESSKRLLLMGMKKKKQRQKQTGASAQMTEADMDNQTLAKRLK